MLTQQLPTASGYQCSCSNSGTVADLATAAVLECTNCLDSQQHASLTQCEVSNLNSLPC